MGQDSHNCVHCGGELYHGRCLECGRISTDSTSSSSSTVSFKHSIISSEDPRICEILVNPNEEIIATLGNSYFQNFITKGEITKAFSVISDKRVYFKGNALTKLANGSFGNINLSKNVDLKDVTGISTTFLSNVGLMMVAIMSAITSIVMFILGIVNNADSGSNYIRFNSYGVGEWTTKSFDSTWFIYGAILVVAAIFFFVLYRISRTNILQIEFAGGIIAFDVKFYSQSECENFQRKLRQAKDKAVENAEQASVRAMQAAVAQIIPQKNETEALTANSATSSQPVSSSADELLKYAELLEKGLISETEFAEAKARILGK